VQEWQATGWSFQDSSRGILKSERVYMPQVLGQIEVLVFDLRGGTRLKALKPQPPDKLEGCSYSCLNPKAKFTRSNTYGNRLSSGSRVAGRSSKVRRLSIRATKGASAERRSSLVDLQIRHRLLR
jgi:hypothetical protein